MKRLIPILILCSAIILLFSISSCNTYKWERKRYYKSNRAKNWNNYNSEKTKSEDDKTLEKYYIKE